MHTPVTYLLIILLFYINLIESIFPRIMGTITMRWPVFYVMSLGFVLFWSVQSKKIIFDRWLGLVILFCLVVFLSISWSPHYSYDLDIIIRFMARYVAPAAIAIITANLISTEKHIGIYVSHFVIVSVILSIIAIVQSIFFPSSSVDTEEGFRASATLGNPNILAMFLVLSVPSVLFCIDRKQLSQRLGYAILCCIGMGILGTASRKGIATFFLCVFLYYLLKFQWKKLATLFALAVLLAGIIFATASISPRFSDRILQREFKQKTNLAKTGLSMFTTSPLIGLGYQGYYENYGRYTKNIETKKYDAHNMYVTVLVDQGIIGFVPFFCIFICPLIRSINTWKNNKGIASDMAIVCITTIAPFMINGFYAGGAFITQSIMFVFFAQVSLCLNACKLYGRKGVGSCSSENTVSTSHNLHHD